MKLTNIKMEQMLTDLKPVLPQRNKIGYIAARNTRILRETLTEYFTFKNELIKKYGEPTKDSGGHETISVSLNSPKFDDFSKEFSEIAEIEHDVEIMTLKYDEVIGFLNGEEILNLSWMLED